MLFKGGQFGLRRAQSKLKDMLWLSVTTSRSRIRKIRPGAHKIRKPFGSYSKALYTGMFAKVLRQTSAIDIFQSCANAFCQVARCVCLQLEQQLRSFYLWSHTEVFATHRLCFLYNIQFIYIYIEIRIRSCNALPTCFSHLVIFGGGIKESSPGV